MSSACAEFVTFFWLVGKADVAFYNSVARASLRTEGAASALPTVLGLLSPGQRQLDPLQLYLLFNCSQFSFFMHSIKAGRNQLLVWGERNPWDMSVYEVSGE